MRNIPVNDGFLTQMRQELECLKSADKEIDSIVPDHLDQIRMHNLMCGAIIVLQIIVQEFEKVTV